MASPAAESMPNGISTPPATATAPTLSPPTQQPQQSQQPTAQPQPAPNGIPPNASSSSSSAAAAMNPAFPSTSLSDPGTSKRPRDARLIHLILANMGVHAYTERVPLQLLDFAYRYTSSIITDALSYEPPLPTTSSSKKRAGGAAPDGSSDEGISLNALRTAVGARAASTFQGTLGKEFMSEVAQEKNRIALPRVEREFGVRLPPERYCFTGVGWGISGAWTEELQEGEEGADDGDMDVDEGFGGGPVAAAVNGVVVGGGGEGGENGEGRDTAMGGMGEEDEDEDQDDDEFEEAMGINRENNL